MLFPEKASLWGLTTVISQEYYWAQCYCLDVGEVHQKDGEVSDLIFSEMHQDFAKRDHAVAYRQGQRFVQQLERMKLANLADRRQPVIREGGVYLLAGGLGYIGLHLATYFAQQAHVTLVLINRTPLPERADWPRMLTASQPQGKVLSRLQGITEIEKLGSEVMYVAADIGDPQAMADVIEHVLQRYGRINGVINATMEWQRKNIEELSQEHFTSSVLNRLRGAYVLDQATRSEKLDFFIIISSLSSLFGGLGQADDVSANCFLDAYGACMEQAGQDVSVLSLPSILEQRPTAVMIGQRILPAISRMELLELFALLICKKTGFVMIEDFDFQEIRQVLPALKVRFAPELLVVENTIVQQPPEVPSSTIQRDGQTLAEQIAGVWSKVLGYPAVGFHDNFFDLGGDSLIAMRVVEQLQDVLGSSVAIADLFKHPTVATLADSIEQRKSSASLTANALSVELREAAYAQQSNTQIGLMKPAFLVAESQDAPLSFIQEKLWFLDQLLPSTTINTVALA
ncbi:MAG: SDR family NAD(P)-dependent oxidoreductase, partial [Ktedonobacteraceae bacterium]